MWGCEALKERTPPVQPIPGLVAFFGDQFQNWLQELPLGWLQLNLDWICMKPHENEALARLIDVAEVPTSQGKRCADFLLAWWNYEECGGFDLTDLWAVDSSLCRDMVTIFALIARKQNYPDTLGYERQFDHLIRIWRPHLLKNDRASP